MKFISYCMMLIFVLSCTQSEADTFDFLIGTWKVENQNQYEVWSRNGQDELIGEGYRIVDNQKVVFESLALKRIDNQVVYEATVPEQNQGTAIQFTLNPENKTLYSFENPDHDFPKKIQYRIVSKNEIIVTVSGDDGEGFELKMIKQS